MAYAIPIEIAGAGKVLSGLPSDVILLYYQIVRLDLIRSLAGQV